MSIEKALINLNKREAIRKQLLDNFRQNEFSGLDSAAEQFSMLFLVKGKDNSQLIPSSEVLNSPEAQQMVKKLQERYDTTVEKLQALSKELDPSGQDRTVAQGIARLKESIEHIALMTKRATGYTLAEVHDWMDEEEGEAGNSENTLVK